MDRKRLSQSPIFIVYVFIIACLNWQCHGGRILSNNKFTVKISSEWPAEMFSTNETVSEEPRTQYMIYRARRMTGECTAMASGNLIDECWRCNPNWIQNRQALVNCAIGAGRDAVGGKNGAMYVVTDNSDADVLNPAPGTLRYGVIQQEPLWIIFSNDMTIQLQNELIMNSFKTLDGRGFDIHISGGAGLTLQYISNVIIHGVHIHNTVPTGPATIRSSPTHAGRRGRTDGDAVNIYGSRDIWIDHCYFAQGADGLVDVTMGSNAITVSNNYFTVHDKVMLFGAHPQDTMDKDMRVTVAYNHFGPGLIERLPRIRYGHVHVVNNMYEGWGMYAIGGSEGPTVVSQGNVFTAPNGVNKEVSKRLQDDGERSYGDHLSWNWQSSDDIFLNGAFFTPSGDPFGSQVYSTAISVQASPATMVATMTANAGPLLCTSDSFC